MKERKNSRIVFLWILIVALSVALTGFSPHDQIVWMTQTPQPGAAPEATTVVRINKPVILTGGGISLKNLDNRFSSPTSSSISGPVVVPILTNTPAPVIPPVIWQPTAIPYVQPTIPQPVYPTAAPRVPYACNVSVNRPYYYQQFNPGDDFDFDVTFTNTGTQAWNTDIDVMQYTGWRMEIEGKYIYDLDKDYPSAQIVQPGQSIRWKIRMEAPKEKTNDKDKYFSTYYLVKGRDFENGRFCPFSVYLYVPHGN